MSVRVGVVVFPGSNCDRDTLRGLTVAGAEPVELWHEQASLDGVAAVVLPGGFAYGDYLRAGVIARFSPVMRSVAAFADEGGLVLGICNGFQVLAEAGLVPGALLRNRSLRFLGRDVTISPERLDTPFTHAIGERRPLRMPIAHGEGCYYADDATLDALERDGQVLFRYVRADGTATSGVTAWRTRTARFGRSRGCSTRAATSAGLMPHPERASEAVLGSEDGIGILRSLVESAAARLSGAGRPVEVGAAR